MLNCYRLPHALQLDLSMLSNQLIRLKIFIEQHLADVTSEDALMQTEREVIKLGLMQFCGKFEESLKSLQNNLVMIFRQYKQGSSKQEQVVQKISQFSEKVTELERSLMKTQENESRLILALNKMMEQSGSLTHNNTVNQQQANHFVPRVPLHMQKRQRQKKGDRFRETVKYQQKNLYLNKDLRQLSREQSDQYIRTFSKGQQGAKRSLKINASYDRLPQHQERSSSREKCNYEHRLKFMMHHLNS